MSLSTNSRIATTVPPYTIAISQLILNSSKAITYVIAIIFLMLMNSQRLRRYDTPALCRLIQNEHSCHMTKSDLIHYFVLDYRLIHALSFGLNKVVLLLLEPWKSHQYYVTSFPSSPCWPPRSPWRAAWQLPRATLMSPLFKFILDLTASSR